MILLSLSCSLTEKTAEAVDVLYHVPLTNRNSTAAMYRQFQPAASFPAQTAASLHCTGAFSHTLEFAGLHLQWQSSNRGSRSWRINAPASPSSGEMILKNVPQFSVSPAKRSPSCPQWQPACQCTFYASLSLMFTCIS